MDNTKNDKYFIDKIKNDISFIVVHMKDVDLRELGENEVLLDSMMSVVEKFLMFRRLMRAGGYMSAK